MACPRIPSHSHYKLSLLGASPETIDHTFILERSMGQMNIRILRGSTLKKSNPQGSTRTWRITQGLAESLSRR